MGGPAATIEEVVKTQQPVVGNVSRQTAEMPPVVVLRVPVVRDGAVQYILTAHVKPESFVTLIREQGLPRDWVSGVVDLQAVTGGRLDAAILRQLLIALAMIIVMLLRPRGLWPTPEHGKSLQQAPK